MVAPFFHKRFLWLTTNTKRWSKALRRNSKKIKKKTNKKSLTERAKKFGMDLFKIKKKKKKMRGSNVHRQPMIKRGDAESKQRSYVNIR